MLGIVRAARLEFADTLPTTYATHKRIDVSMQMTYTDDDEDEDEDDDDDTYRR